ncbi:hypothetical protein BI364_14505 [Acidihalobacter yilgarnensis]|uniref:Uncharacterized protein n=1 Tax=Acidihalobacter yilgarnensis TaxID=2819280 RepID=A0A1D8IRH5_9GAMM|nr:hypothetical protein BI364_14505 [Acidihalobacter yilgarnensis]
MNLQSALTWVVYKASERAFLACWLARILLLLMYADRFRRMLRVVMDEIIGDTGIDQAAHA